jgi:DNA polymerase-3 subunit epsilon
MNYLEDKKKSIDWAKSILDRNNWAIIDTETTGLGGDAQIVEIAVLTPEYTYRQYVKPTNIITKDATNIHGIKYEDVENSPYFEEIFIEVWKSIGRSDVIIYNADFDLKLIRQSLRARNIQIAFPTSDRRGCQIFVNGGSIHCAMHYYSQYVGDWNEYYGNYHWQKLPGGDHSALGDCEAVLEIIKEMAADECN